MLALLLLGCAEPPSPGPEEAPAPRSDEAAPSALALATNRFAVELWPRLGAGNLVWSPLSVAAALAMARAGADGETAAQMDAVLHGGELEAWRVLLARLRAPGGARIEFASFLFAQRDHALLPPWVDAVRSGLGAEPRSVDFVADAEGVRRELNGWVAEQTRGQIRELVPAGGVDAETRLVFGNAVWFLAKWEAPFSAAATRPQAFHAPSGTRELPTMHLVESLAVGRADEATVLALPYEGEQRFLLVLPDAVDGLAALEAKLGPDSFARWRAALAPERVSLALPRFELEGAGPMRLKAALAAAGMPLAFDRERADFGRIALPPRPEERLVVAEVFHAAKIRVDEAGTEAAAATAVSMARAGGAPQRPREVKADHPFLFFVEDRRSGMILFWGRVVEP